MACTVLHHASMQKHTHCPQMHLFSMQSQRMATHHYQADQRCGLCRWDVRATATLVLHTALQKRRKKQQRMR